MISHRRDDSWSHPGETEDRAEYSRLVGLQWVAYSHIIRRIRDYGGSMGSFAALPYPHIDPVFLEFGPLQFRWYGLMYLIGLTAAPAVWRRYK